MADIRVRSRVMSAAPQVGATEDGVIDQSHRGNSAVVGLLDAPLNADLWRPAGADRWKAWDGFLESNAETGFMQSSWWSDFRATTG